MKVHDAITKYKVSSVTEASCTPVDTVAHMYTILLSLLCGLDAIETWPMVLHRMHNYVYGSVHMLN